MKYVWISIVISAMVGIGLVSRHATASAANPHNVVQVTQDATRAGTLDVSITGTNGSPSYTVTLGAGQLTATLNAQAIAAAINSAVPQKYAATVGGAGNDTVTVTVPNTIPPVPAHNVQIGADKTGEASRHFRKLSVGPEDFEVGFDGLVSGTVVVEIPSHTASINTTGMTLSQVHVAIRNSFMLAGISASINASGFVVIWVPGGDTWVEVDCTSTTLDVEIEGFVN